LIVRQGGWESREPPQAEGWDGSDQISPDPPLKLEPTEETANRTSSNAGGRDSTRLPIPGQKLPDVFKPQLRPTDCAGAEH